MPRLVLKKQSRPKRHVASTRRSQGEIKTPDVEMIEPQVIQMDTITLSDGEDIPPVPWVQNEVIVASTPIASRDTVIRSENSVIRPQEQSIDCLIEDPIERLEEPIELIEEPIEHTEEPIEHTEEPIECVYESIVADDSIVCLDEPNSSARNSAVNFHDSVIEVGEVIRERTQHEPMQGSPDSNAIGNDRNRHFYDTIDVSQVRPIIYWNENIVIEDFFTTSSVYPSSNPVVRETVIIEDDGPLLNVDPLTSNAHFRESVIIEDDGPLLNVDPLTSNAHVRESVITENAASSQSMDLSPSHSEARESLGNAESVVIQCPICFENILKLPALKRKLVSTLCGHIFCDECLQLCMREKKECPTCRKPMKVKDFHPVYLK